MLPLNEWVCVAHNPMTGVSTWLLDDGEDLLVQERQDVSALLDENKALRNVASDNWRGDGMFSVARLPLAMVYEKDSLIGGAIREGDEKVVNRFLNDSDYRDLRTKEGQL